MISIVAGLLILFDLPSSAGWTLGTIVGAALFLQGVSLTLLGLEVRHSPSRTSPRLKSRKHLRRGLPLLAGVSYQACREAPRETRPGN